MTPIIFLRVTWMKRYKGPKGDPPKGGGKHIEEYGEGGEMFNFRNENGKAFGYTQSWSINLNRLEAQGKELHKDNVTVVWFARNPQYGGQYIVGWFPNARVYRKKQKGNLGKERSGWYNVEAKYSKCVLIPEDEREFELKNPPPGQNFVWYGHEKMSAGQLKEVWDYINHRKIPPINKKSKHGRAFQPDIEKRLRVEKNAVNIAIRYFETRNFKIERVEKLNKGWDIEATKNARKFNIEVKGFSGEEVFVELTPNEFLPFSRRKKNYILFIVTKALDKKPKHYYFRIVRNKWLDYENNSLHINIRRSAQLTLK